MRLLGVDHWSHAPGLSTWKVPSGDLAQSFASFATAEEVDEELWCRKGGLLAPTMFPPKDPEVRGIQEHKLIRIIGRGLGMIVCGRHVLPAAHGRYGKL